MISKRTHPNEYTSIGREYGTFSLSEHSNSGANHLGVPILVVIKGASNDTNLVFLRDDDKDKESVVGDSVLVRS